MLSQVEQIVFAGLMPHPPIVVPGVGRERANDVVRTQKAMRELARECLAHQPESLVLVSPHAPRRPRCFGLYTDAELGGSLERFGAPRDRVDFVNDHDLQRKIEKTCDQQGIVTWRIQGEPLDHGAVVPLWYFQEAGWNGPVVVIGLNYPGEGALESLGHAIAKAAQSLDRRVALIASGDMSHRLKPGAPGGYNPKAQDFDTLFVKLLEEGRDQEIRHFDPELQSLAGEDVVDSSIVAMAASGFSKQNRRLLSYEGPFGVGYSVAVIATNSLATPLPEEEPQEREDEIGLKLLRTARSAVENFVTAGSDPSYETPSEPYLQRAAGVFVTIRTSDGELRGCIGTIGATRGNVVEETAYRAIAAACQDMRFEPVREEELEDLFYEVSVLHPPERIESEEDLDPERYGVIVADAAGRRGVMLPGVEGLDTPERQIMATMRKVGIPRDEPVILHRFQVDKFAEEPA